ncbi:Hypothetical protein; putative membrane protein [Herminiimonas arsenicoxydans]|uniref:Transmembrane protein n=1 Tax=Herminiimonas arsenicoxydans TaxID=204773 RepID=A4G6D1_HERAR|nr:Hypothetical protein; putative membrane protein [Herminiimonas arsenicoxydans]
MNTFGPRQVDASSWRRWVSEALHLSSKHFVLNVALVLFTLGVASQFPALVLTIISPVLVGAFVLVAYSADSSESLAKVLKSSSFSLLRILFCSAATVLTMTIAMFVILHIVQSTVVPSGEPSVYIEKSHQLSEFMAGSKALFSIGIWLLVILPWFAIPLIVCTDLPLRLCLDHTFKAFNQNKFVVIVVFVCAVLLMGGALLHGLTVVPLYPILGGILYASYRHIFLGLPPLETASEKVKLPRYARIRQ